MQDQLSKDDWIAQGLRTLAREGANALKVGPMSARLKVSRGSFYWHFRDIADFRVQVLRSWLARLRSTGAARTTLARRGSAARTFTAWAHRRGLMTADPGLLLATPKGHPPLPDVPQSTRTVCESLLP